MFTVLEIVNEYSVFDPSDLTFAVVFGVQNKLFSACSQGVLFVDQLIKMIKDRCMNEFIINLLFVHNFIFYLSK